MQSPQILYDFVAKAQEAEWWGYKLNADGSIPARLNFPGKDDENDGFALWRDNFLLENDSRPARVLETHPAWISGGEIIGYYPLTFALKPGDRFVARVGFLKNAEAGDVTFKLGIGYQGEFSGMEKVVWTDSRNDNYNGQIVSWEVTLPEEVDGANAVMLGVYANQTSSQDWAVWEVARLERP